MLSDTLNFVPYAIKKHRKVIVLLVIGIVGFSFGMAAMFEGIDYLAGKSFDLLDTWFKLSIIVGGLAFAISIVALCVSELIQ